MMAALMNPVRLEQHQVAEQASTEQALACRHVAAFAAGRPSRFKPIFSVSVTLEDGTQAHWVRFGGSTLDHTLEASDLYGLQCTVRVRKIGGMA